MRRVILDTRKSIKDLISDLVDCGACFRRPHTIFGRVRNVEVKPRTFDGTPPYLGIRKYDPVGAQGRLRSPVGRFPEARPVLGEVTETLCAAGTEDLGGPDVGAFPGRAKPRVRVNVYIGFML